ncbi:hypothetical protein [Pantoea conspicua]|uniref:hypothetical protein n=1 Tax=Pantoea conspicua TaxID=472705 RepID=UPI001ABFF27D|nr:hypothetical protein [Pantoea conspicua]
MALQFPAENIPGVSTISFFASMKQVQVCRRQSGRGIFRIPVQTHFAYCHPRTMLYSLSFLRAPLMQQFDPQMLLLLYFVLPVWLIAGFADWICHRATDIENTTGLKETWIHILMFLEMGLPLLSALFLEVNALVFAFMIVLFFCHEATALWDVSYAVTAREVKPIEQHIHSFLEMVPLMALLLVISRHWSQFQALFGFGDERPVLS